MESPRAISKEKSLHNLEKLNSSFLFYLSTIQTQNAHLSSPLTQYNLRELKKKS